MQKFSVHFVLTQHVVGLFQEPFHLGHGKDHLRTGDNVRQDEDFALLGELIEASSAEFGNNCFLDLALTLLYPMRITSLSPKKLLQRNLAVDQVSRLPLAHGMSFGRPCREKNRMYVQFRKATTANPATRHKKFEVVKSMAKEMVEEDRLVQRSRRLVKKNKYGVSFGNVTQT